MLFSHPWVTVARSFGRYFRYLSYLSEALLIILILCYLWFRLDSRDYHLDLWWFSIRKWIFSRELVFQIAPGQWSDHHLHDAVRWNEQFCRFYPHLLLILRCKSTSPCCNIMLWPPSALGLRALLFATRKYNFYFRLDEWTDSPLFLRVAGQCGRVLHYKSSPRCVTNIIANQSKEYPVISEPRGRLRTRITELLWSC